MRQHPGANPAAADLEPDGTWYSLVQLDGILYSTEPNHQLIVRISPNGHVRQVADFSATFPGNPDWRGPTPLATRDQKLFTGTLTPFPVVPGAAQVFEVNPISGRFGVRADGLTTVLGLTFDRRGAMYVLEMSVVPGFPTPNSGQIVRIRGNQRTVIATGLDLPTAITYGPDGNLYVSNKGFRWGSQPTPLVRWSKCTSSGRTTTEV